MSSPVDVTLAGREAAAELRTDTCTVVREDRSGRGTFDAANGVTVWPSSNILTDEPCRLKQPTETHRRLFAGEHEFLVGDLVLAVDVNAVMLRVKDVVTITSSQLDADSVGAQFTVEAIGRGSQITARRYAVREVMT